MTTHNIVQLRKIAADSTLSDAERAGAEDILRAWSETQRVYDHPEAIANSVYASFYGVEDLDSDEQHATDDRSALLGSVL